MFPGFSNITTPPWRYHEAPFLVHLLDYSFRLNLYIPINLIQPNFFFSGSHENQKPCSCNNLVWAAEGGHSRTVPMGRWNPLTWIHQLVSRGAEQRSRCWTVHRDTGVREMERCEMHHGLQIDDRLWETLAKGELSWEPVTDKKTWLERALTQKPVIIIMHHWFECTLHEVYFRHFQFSPCNHTALWIVT